MSGSRTARRPPRASLAAVALSALAIVACDEPSASPSTPPRAGIAPRAAPERDTLAATREEARVVAVPPRTTGDAFLGEPDAPRLEALATRAIASIEKGRGGRSLAFRLTLDDGTRGYFKPEQSFSAAHWYAEIAAYHLDRALGLGRVAPVIGRRLAWEPLRRVAGDDERVAEITVAEDGTVRGAFIWWIPEELPELTPGRRWERWIRVDPNFGISPFQRPWDFRRQVQAWKAGSPIEPAEDLGPEREPDTADRAAELSDMILFDHLTTNVDRWGGAFTNVRARGAGGPLIFLDNGAGFSPGQVRIDLMEQRLRAVQKFRRSTVGAIRALDLDRYRERLAGDPLAPVLDDRQLTDLAARREAVLEHVAACERRFGDAVFAW